MMHQHVFDLFAADSESNVLIQPNVVVVWLFRNHNRMARILETMNPCWNDEQIYSTVKDIQIAMMNQIWYYEMFPAILGKYVKQLYPSHGPILGLQHQDNENYYTEIQVNFSFLE